MAWKLESPNRGVQKWLLAALCVIAISYSLFHYQPQPFQQLLGKKPPSPSYVADNLNDNLLNLSQYKDPAIELDAKSELYTLQHNDDFLPYFASLGGIPKLYPSTARGSCNYTDEELESFEGDHGAWWKVDPLTNENIDEFRDDWQQHISSGFIPWSKVSGRFYGRGIVILAGTGRSLTRVKVTLRALQQHGSNLPIEIHYYGSEMNETDRADIAQVHNSSEIYFNDLSESHNVWQTHYNPMIGINYQLKIAALVNTRFLEPLLLDSDNVPVCDPESLWDSESYKQFGAVFWPDIQRTRPDHPAWAVTNHACDRSEYEFESGQVLVNKGRLFYHLQLAAWFTTQPFWVASVLGDKDIFRFAWHALKTKFGTPAKWVTSLGFMIEQEFLGYTTQKYCGHTFAQHHPDHSTLNGDRGSGVAFLHGGTLKTMIAPMLARLRKLNGGIYTHYKQVDASKLEDWSQIEYHVGVRFLHAGQYLNATSHYAPSELVEVDEDLDKDGMPIGEDGLEKLKLSEDDLGKLMWCVDFEAVDAKPVEDWGEDGKGWEQTFDRAGGYWMIEDGYRWS